MAKPLISVVLCTYNRAHLLVSALTSLVSQSLDPRKYEIVTVDNASTDETAAVIRGFQARYTWLEINYVFEAKQGLGYARNTGYQNARGCYITFIDDDCFASSDWLQTILNCYENVRPRAWGVGGLICPIYEGPKPTWFKDEYETDTWGESPRLLKRRESFTGCNMSFRRELIEKYGGFDVELDMKGGTLSLAGETEFYRRIWNTETLSPIFRYTPDAVMYHKIDAYKMTVSYQLKRAFSAGQASWYMGRMEPLVRRCLMCLGSIALIVWHSLIAVLLVRPRHLHNWAVEKLRPVAFNVGTVSAYCGAKPLFNQRQTTHEASL